MADTIKFLEERGIPKTKRKGLAAKIERLILRETLPTKRRKWDERGKYAELKDLSAPQFLKAVYPDAIAPDGTVEKIAIRAIDRKLMASVDAYVYARESREQDLGDARGLRFVSMPTHQKGATLG
jgi:hypothetical protein